MRPTEREEDFGRQPARLDADGKRYAMKVELTVPSAHCYLLAPPLFMLIAARVYIIASA